MVMYKIDRRGGGGGLGGVQKSYTRTDPTKLIKLQNLFFKTFLKLLQLKLDLEFIYINHYSSVNRLAILNRYVFKGTLSKLAHIAFRSCSSSLCICCTDDFHHP